MTKCTKCKLKYPDHLVSQMASNVGGKLTYTTLCAVCALEVRNLSMGLPLDTPFTGEMASVMYDEAVIYKTKHYDKST